MDLPSLADLYTRVNLGGLEDEGRNRIQGLDMMKIASYTRQLRLTNFKWSIGMPEDVQLPFPIKFLEYEGWVETFLPLDMFPEVKRYDTVCSSYLTYQEGFRHLALASKFTAEPYFDDIIELKNAYFDEIKQTILAASNDLLQGHRTLEQFIFYVRDHEDSASPFGGKWGTFIDTPRMREAWIGCDKFLQNFVKDYERMPIIGKDLLVKAKMCYPGRRARPANYLFQKLSERTGYFRAKKWRDRQVGGVPGLSQMMYPVYHNELKIKNKMFWFNLCKKILGNMEVHMLTIEGPQVYLDLLKYKPRLYDLKTAEKATGLLFRELGLAVEMGHPSFPSNMSPKMYSGIGWTPDTNEVNTCLYLRALKDRGWTGTKVWLFSDNFAVDVPLTEGVGVWATEEKTFCGLDIEKECFYPPSLCTDNPSHRTRIKGDKHSQVQQIQYFARPLMAIVTNNIMDRGSCKKFLQWVVDRQNFDKFSYEGAMKDKVIDWISEKPEEVETLKDKFVMEYQFMRQYIPTQERDPSWPTDLKIM